MSYVCGGKVGGSHFGLRLRVVRGCWHGGDALYYTRVDESHEDLECRGYDSDPGDEWRLLTTNDAVKVLYTAGTRSLSKLSTRGRYVEETASRLRVAVTSRFHFNDVSGEFNYVASIRKPHIIRVEIHR